MKLCNAIKASAAAVLAAILCAGCGSGTAESSVTPETSAVLPDAAAITTDTDDVMEESAAESKSSAGDVLLSRSELLKCIYYDDREFCSNEEKSVIYETSGEPLCGIAPHHLAAGHFIAGMYRTAAEKRARTDTVVLLAPMHYDGKNTLITSKNGWDTAFGASECDTGAAELFIDRLGAKIDDEMIQYDHSASTHIPFIRRYFPDAEIVCLLVSPKEPQNISERLADALYELSEMKSCFFAFSIDFSHYLDPDEADKHDKETLEAVLSGDTDRIARFTNANVDTPYCLNAFVRLSELLGAKPEKADNSNTYRVGNLPYSRELYPEGVTSYFVYFAS